MQFGKSRSCSASVQLQVRTASVLWSRKINGNIIAPSRMREHFVLTGAIVGERHNLSPCCIANNACPCDLQRSLHNN